MMLNYKWSIRELECLKNFQGKENYVIRVHWSYTISNGMDQEDENYISTEIFSAITFDACDDQSNFILYSDLTENKIIEWLEGSLDVEALQLELQEKLNEIINPSIIQLPLPWQS